MKNNIPSKLFQQGFYLNLLPLSTAGQNFNLLTLTFT